MTAKHHHRLARMFTPRQQWADTRYGLHILDGSRDEYAVERGQVQRQAAADDPWLSPERSALVRECLIRISHAANHTPLLASQQPELDLRGLCEDAELTDRQIEVVVMTGEGWSQRQIAALLEISQPAVWAHLHHGRRRLVGWLPPLVALALDMGLSEGVYKR